MSFQISEGPKRSKSNAASATATSSSALNDKIEISEDHLYGPFDFSAHRRDTVRSKARPKFRVRDDLQDLAFIDDTSSSSKSKSPPLIDLGTTPPPQFVDLAVPDQTEIHELVSYLSSMFPDTPKMYFEDQADELVGKPAALDRLILEFILTVLLYLPFSSNIASCRPSSKPWSSMSMLIFGVLKLLKFCNKKVI